MKDHHLEAKIFHRFDLTSGPFSSFPLALRLSAHPLPPCAWNHVMPKYYCDYCDTFLTHDSASVRKSHMEGTRHQAAVRAYYAQLDSEYKDTPDRETMRYEKMKGTILEMSNEGSNVRLKCRPTLKLTLCASRRCDPIHVDGSSYDGYGYVLF